MSHYAMKGYYTSKVTKIYTPTKDELENLFLDFLDAVRQLNKMLTGHKYIVGDELSVADVALYSEL